MSTEMTVIHLFNRCNLNEVYRVFLMLLIQPWYERVCVRKTFIFFPLMSYVNIRKDKNDIKNITASLA